LKTHAIYGRTTYIRRKETVLIRRRWVLCATQSWCAYITITLSRLRKERRKKNGKMSAIYFEMFCYNPQLAQSDISEFEIGFALEIYSATPGTSSSGCMMFSALAECIMFGRPLERNWVNLEFFLSPVN
jgi:hypothetical protein